MLWTLEKLYAVSDLHIGGPAGLRAFREADALAWLILQVANDTTSGRIGLLLNGDVFDFLAFPGTLTYFTQAADQMIRGFANDPELKPIFDALKELVGRPNRALIIQLGNHDIELALPHVQQAFLECIGAVLPTAAGNVHFECSGEGWSCVVNGALVRAVHGNASDPWNAVDHAGLEAKATALASARPADDPKPNAGTMMVINVVNVIKRKLPFVDLLKPEGAPLMAVLEAVKAPKPSGVARAVLQLDVQRGTAAELLGMAPAQASSGDPTPKQILARFLESREPASSEDILLRMEQHLDKRVTPRELVTDDREHLRLTGEWIQSVSYRVIPHFGRPEKTLLRQALLSWLAEDQSFELTYCSPADAGIVRTTPRDVDYLVAGHTHLPRSFVPRGRGLLYLNTGTWMRVLKLHGSQYLENNAEFERFWTAITVEPAPPRDAYTAIDALTGLDPRDRPVAIVDKSGAQLFSVRGTPPTYRLERRDTP